MMLIDIEAVLKAAELAGKEYVSIDFLRDFEQVDAVLVVRCKDCAHGRYDDESEMYECGYVGLALYNEPNHYCSYGEKLEGKP